MKAQRPLPNGLQCSSLRLPPVAGKARSLQCSSLRLPPVAGKARSSAVLRDVHSEEDPRKLDLERAGVTGLRYPISVRDREQGIQHTVAEIDMSVSLPHKRKGAHMSRFVELLNRHRREIDIRKFRELCSEIRRDHDASAAHVTVRFPYFIEKRAPVTGAAGLVDYACTFGASVRTMSAAREKADLWVGVEVPVTSLCPCSKAISERSAHNQRSVIRVKVWFAKFFWIEDLISLVESCASCDLYAVLKRPDEKYVTERAYSRPRFVEDLVREVGTRLKAQPAFPRFEVSAESFESIHAHSAYARFSYPPPQEAALPATPVAEGRRPRHRIGKS